MTLNAFSIERAKPAERAYKLADGGGLFLLIQPSGSKLWRLRYFYLGKERTCRADVRAAGEIRLAKRAEIDFTKAVWRIPAERTKMRRPHDVPLSRQAVAVLNEIWPVSEMSDLIFPSTRSFLRPLSDNAFNARWRRMALGSTGNISAGPL